ncbi:Macrolide export protein MacA [Thalassocella blandensis]|nr:Macrolide export protein MacA [Thalassocella blandensis]
MKKTLIIPILAITVVLAVSVGWFMHSSEDAESLKFYGNVDIRQVSLAFEGNGRLLQLMAEEGDEVKQGDLLAVIDTETLVLQSEQVKAQIEVQSQNLQKLQNGARPEEIAQARSRYAAAQADAQRAKHEYERLKSVVEKTNARGVSAQDLDRAKSALKIADAKVAEAGEALRLIELGARTEEVAAAQAQLKSMQAELAILQHQIDLGELKAPSDAIVRSRLLEPGEMASQQRPVFSLALMHPKWVRIYLSENDLGKVKPGMKAHICSDSHPDTFVEGTVGYISSVAEFTPKFVQTEELRTSLVYEARIIVQDENNQLRLGQPVTVKLVSGSL